MILTAVLWPFGVWLLLCPNIVRGEGDSVCSELWFISVNEHLTINWSGEDRDGTIEVTVTTQNDLGRPCTKSETVKAEFKRRVLSVKDPCSNALYEMAATLTCSDIVKRHNSSVWTPPDAPGIFNFTATNTTVKFFWKAPPGVVKQYRARVTKENRSVVEIKTKDSGTLFADFVDLHPYTEYGVSVSASNQDHWGNWSEPMIFMTEQGVPHVPRNLSVTLVESSRIQLWWEEPSPSTGPVLWYDVRWVGTVEENDRSQLVNETSCYIEHLYSYTDYTVWVTANTEVGSGPSANLTVKTDLAVPDPPAFDCEASNTSILVSWELSPVYRGPDPTYFLRWKMKDLKSTSKTLSNLRIRNHTITGLMPFKTYEVQMRAHNDAGVGRWSDVAEVETLIGIPSLARNLRIFSKSSRDIVVQWDVPEPPNSPVEDLRYDIDWRTKPEKWRRSTTTDTRFHAPDLIPYTDYEFQARAQSDAGIGNWTNVLMLKTDISIPSEPLNLTEVKRTNTSIQIQWLPPKHRNGPHVSYVVRWSVIPDDLKGEEAADDSSCCREEVNVTEYEMKDLNPYSNYSIEVCSKTSAGQGNCTEPIIFETYPGIPSAPTHLRLSDVQQTGLTLQWSAPDSTNGPLDGYVLHWGISGTRGSHVREQGTTYKALGLRPYTDYFFEIAAQTLGGIGAFKDIHGRTAIATPSVPRDVTYSKVTDRSILLEWSPPEHPNAPAVQYFVKWRWNSPESPTLVHETNATAFEVRTLEASSNYSIEVCAETEVGKGPWSAILYVQTREKDRSSAIIAGSVVGIFVVLFVVSGVILLQMAKRKGGLKNVMRSETGAAPVEALQKNVSMLQMDVLEDSERLNVRNLDRHVLELMRHGYCKLSEEFEKLTRESGAAPSLEARKSDNLIKNRWVKILPFDYSRVKLMSVEDDVEPDYINASYIPGDSHLLEYIATQGPMANTVNDFWRMVWQQSVFLIVMLTQCVERAKRTCERYWPSPGETAKYGMVDVHTVSESITPAYIARVFLITQSGKRRHVIHLHYTSWPVSGCPKSPDNFLTFVRGVRSQITSAVTGPMLVHCSAGIGRTGTFIAVDRLSQGIARNSEEVDIFGTVLDMRKHRPCMVQTEEQYYFIYLCLQKIVQEKRVEKEGDYAEGIYSN